MKIIEVGKPRAGLNVSQLLNPIFFDHMWPLGEPHQRRRPDMTRQHSRRQRAKDLRAARELKAAYVPLCFVDPTVYLERAASQYDFVVILDRAARRAMRRRCEYRARNS